MPDRQREGAVNALSDVRQEALSLLAGQGDSLAIAGALLMDILGPVASTRGSVRRWRPVVEKAQAAGSAPRYRPPGQPDPAPGVPVLAVPLREGSKCHGGFPLPKHKQRQGQGLAAGVG